MKVCTFEATDMFPIYPLTIGFDEPQMRVFRPNGMVFNQIFLVNEGCGHLAVSGSEYELECGDMFFIRKNTEHLYEGSADFKTSFLGFSGDLSNNIFKFYNIGDHIVYKNKKNKKNESLWADFYEEFDNISDYPIMSSKTYSLVVSFFAENAKATVSDIESVKQYLELNFSKSVAVSDILEIYPHSKSKLYRDFAAEYNMSIFDMLTKIRLKHARLLITTDPYIRLSVVADSCGFNDVSYLCKLYKKEYGKSPKFTSK